MAIIAHVSDTPLGDAVLERAVEEAALRQEPVVLTGSITLSRGEFDAGDFRQRRAEFEVALTDQARQLEQERGVSALVWLPSSPMGAADAVLAAAHEHAASLIVVGIRRRSPVGKLVLGSATQDIILAAECAVLGVKLPAEVEEAQA